jgi:hypothetical protein
MNFFEPSRPSHYTIASFLTCDINVAVYLFHDSGSTLLLAIRAIHKMMPPADSNLCSVPTPNSWVCRFFGRLTLDGVVRPAHHIARRCKSQPKHPIKMLRARMQHAQCWQLRQMRDSLSKLIVFDNDQFRDELSSQAIIGFTVVCKRNVTTPLQVTW